MPAIIWELWRAFRGLGVGRVPLHGVQQDLPRVIRGKDAFIEKGFEKGRNDKASCLQARMNCI
jgi:hypothetical protein